MFIISVSQLHGDSKSCSIIYAKRASFVCFCVHVCVFVYMCVCVCMCVVHVLQMMQFVMEGKF